MKNESLEKISEFTNHLKEIITEGNEAEFFDGLEKINITESKKKMFSEMIKSLKDNNKKYKKQKNNSEDWEKYEKARKLNDELTIILISKKWFKSIDGEELQKDYLKLKNEKERRKNWNKKLKMWKKDAQRLGKYGDISITGSLANKLYNSANEKEKARVRKRIERLKKTRLL